MKARSQWLRLAAAAAVVCFALALPTVAAAEHHEKANPCNPCAAKAANPCNPCAAKAANPCNPCAAKQANPCAEKPANPCNPCGAAEKANPCSGH